MLKNKVIVITGGAGLIGQELAQAVACNGGTAIIADINEAAAIKVKEQIDNTSHNGKIDTASMDISSRDSIRNTIASLHDKYHHIDAVVNSAYPKNKNYGRLFFDVEPQDFIENISLNLGGWFLVSQQFAEYFKEQGHGNIVILASIYGVMAPRFEIYENTSMTMPVEYAVIKSGQIHLTRYMAKYLKGTNIRVNSISPGGVIDQQPDNFKAAYRSYCLNKGMLENSDLNGALIFLLSDMSSFVNGQNIIVDDGFSL